MKKLVATYARVSTSNQENEGTIENQLMAMRDFAKANNLEIVKSYEDNGWSGSTLERPSLDKLRMDAGNEAWEAVLAYDPDRIARSATWQEVFFEELTEKSIDVLFVTVPPAKNDEDALYRKMRGVFSEHERIRIKERFRLGKVRKARDGHIIATEAPYGYTFIPKQGKKGDPDFRQGFYQIDPEEANIVKNIFRWVADEGLTLRGVVRRLHELGIPPRKSKRGVWNTSTLSTMLKNKTYIGQAHFNASYAVIPKNPLKSVKYKKNKKTSRKIRPEEEWIKIPTPRIIEDDLFFRTGKRMKENFQNCIRNTKNEYLLSGKIYCACGNRRCGEGPQQGKHLYYRCNNRVLSYPLERTCFEKGVNARITDIVVWQKIKELITSPELLYGQVKRWQQQKSAAFIQSEDSIEKLQKDLEKCKIQENRFEKAYGEGLISLEKLKSHLAPIRDTIRSLEGRLSTCLERESIPKTLNSITETEVEAFAQKAVNRLQNLNFNEKKGIISAILEKVIATQDKLQVWGQLQITKENIYVEQITSDRNCWVAQRRKIYII